MKITKFNDLNIWKLSLHLTKQIYDITSIGRFMTDYGLKDQMRRAVISISSNIVEGFEKNNNNEFIRYLKIAKGSTGELRSQLFIALEIGYINFDHFKIIDKQLNELLLQTRKFISYLQTKRKNKEFINKY